MIWGKSGYNWNWSAEVSLLQSDACRVNRSSSHRATAHLKPDLNFVHAYQRNIIGKPEGSRWDQLFRATSPRSIHRHLLSRHVFLRKCSPTHFSSPFCFLATDNMQGSLTVLSLITIIIIIKHELIRLMSCLLYFNISDTDTKALQSLPGLHTDRLSLTSSLNSYLPAAAAIWASAMLEIWLLICFGENILRRVIWTLTAIWDPSNVDVHHHTDYKRLRLHLGWRQEKSRWRLRSLPRWLLWSESQNL